MSSAVKYEGVPVFMGGMEYTIPPLSIKYIRMNKEKLASLRTLSANLDVLSPEGEAFFVQALDLIHAAIIRNYPEVTRDDLEDMVDLGTLPTITLAIMSASGFVSREGPKSPGEPVAASA